MITYKELMIKLDEQKQVGTLYHFTTLDALFAIFDKNSKYNAKLVTGNQGISLTRNLSLSTNINHVLGGGGFSSTSGYVVRIALDGNKISNKYKIKPVRGMADSGSDSNPLDVSVAHSKRMKSRVEAEEVVVTNALELKPYIKQIDILAVPLTRELESEIIKLLKDNNIKTDVNGFQRKWQIVEGHTWQHPSLSQQLYTLESK